MCEALNVNALNTKNKHEKTVINEAKMLMVEMVTRKFGTTCVDFEETMKFLKYVPIATVLKNEKHGEIAKMGKTLYLMITVICQVKVAPLMNLCHQQKIAAIAAVKVRQRFQR